MHRTPPANDDSLTVRDAQFDAAMRAHHADAVASVSPRVAAQLRQRQRVALSGTATRKPRLGRFAWPVGAAMAASFAALVAFVAVPRLPDTATAPPAATHAATARATAPVGDDDAVTSDVILDDDPDFYAWLGSSDASSLAME